MSGVRHDVILVLGRQIPVHGGTLSASVLVHLLQAASTRSDAHNWTGILTAAKLSALKYGGSAITAALIRGHAREVAPGTLFRGFVRRQRPLPPPVPAA